MVKAKRHIPKLPEFKQPLVAGSSSRDQSRITRVLDQRLDQLCAEFGITSADRHHELCLVLLADVIGLRGFQVLAELPKRRAGAPTKWTWKRHLFLLEFMDKFSKGSTRKQAFDRARDKFSKELSDPRLTTATVRAEYYRAKKFFESKSRLSAAVRAATLRGAGPFLNFIKNGARVISDSGSREISHLGRPKRT
jgi:hypothetical protein